MPVLTSSDVWAKVMEDPEIAQQPESVRDALRPYIEALPTVLADQLDQPADLANVMKAKIAFLRYCVDNGFIRAMVEAIPDEALGFMSRGSLPDMLQSQMSGLIDAAEELTGDVKSLLDAQGVTEKQVMLSDDIGLNEEARSLYEVGSLTIGELLQVQPMVIAKNS